MAHSEFQDLQKKHDRAQALKEYQDFKQSKSRQDSAQALKWFRKKHGIKGRMTHNEIHFHGAWVAEPSDPTLVEFQRHILQHKFQRDYQFFKEKEAYREMLAKKRQKERKKKEEVEEKKAPIKK